MSFIVPSPQDCCRPACNDVLVENIPGAQGATGAAGTNGTNGINAFTTVAEPFAMPAEGQGVLVTLTDGTWCVLGQNVALGLPGEAAFGYFQVVGITDSTHVTLLNLADTAAGEYITNSAPGTAFVAGIAVGPAGLQGPAGAAGASGAPVGATYITQTPDASLTNEQALSALGTGLLKSTFATGVVTSVPIGIADDNAVTVDQAAGLTAGDVVFATASGVETVDDATAIAALGLGTMATQDANNVNITGGTISGITLSPSPGLIGAWILCQNIQATTVNAGGIASGSWVKVPINTEVVDTGGDALLAANIITLTAGTYRIRWRVPCMAVDDFATRLYNFTTAAVIAYGSNTIAAASDSSSSESCGECRVAVTAATQIWLEAQAGATNLTTGFGEANNFGGSEVYASIELEKETS